MKYPWRIALAIFVGSALWLFGYRLGIYEASERFYDKCEGGSVTMTTPSGTAQVVGCAELARRIR